MIDQKAHDNSITKSMGNGMNFNFSATLRDAKISCSFPANRNRAVVIKLPPPERKPILLVMASQSDKDERLHKHRLVCARNSFKSDK